MSSNHPSIRVRGQLSIPSTFIHRTSTEDDQSGDSRGKMKDGQQSKKRPKISLSAFLDRKLQKTSDSSKLVQGKERPFFTLGGANDSLHKANLDQKTEGPELNGILDVLENFKPIKDNKDTVYLNPEESQTQYSTTTHVTEKSQIQDLTKSRNAFGGLLRKPPAPKVLVVLGGDPKPKQTKHRKSFIRNKKPLPHYNHYAGGSGWWDSDMEGIDNEAVGFNEVWEGVGSTTLGGLDWH
ncbi:uncharacterized protein LOC111912050 [Lactuca sativa]|uniref:Uncharacterized protein n=1 Tax=Lactuca sativa TaxID=4236 RepID=A0A9R1X4E3_LACSA|nr:uncharacterized protein LOC111912050 [Lactuca sativa]KAJ0198876.1 hypothetical protein LSAT_V11C600321300 [Lactuca sativa]